MLHKALDAFGLHEAHRRPGPIAEASSLTTPRHPIERAKCRLRRLRLLPLASAPSAATEPSPPPADPPVSPDAFLPAALSAPVAAPDVPTASSPAGTTARNRCLD